MPRAVAPLLILASRSARRAALLRDAGYRFEQRDPPYDDPPQPRHTDPDHTAEQLAVDLARRKALSLRPTLTAELTIPLKVGRLQSPGTAPHAGSPRPTNCPAVILAADTLCVTAAGDLVGQPRDARHARAMIRQFVGQTHQVVTGVALLDVAPPSDVADEPDCFADTARVTLGRLDDDQLDAYIRTDQWRGKAGGYNLFDRLQAGWPLHVVGDPATVVGLPMRRLPAALARHGVMPGQ